MVVVRIATKWTIKDLLVDFGRKYTRYVAVIYFPVVAFVLI